MVRFTTASGQRQIRQMLDLQDKNLSKKITAEEAKEQGFVTAQHNEELLSAMNQQYPHSIAVDNDEVVGYALVMTQDFKHKIPVLLPMFEQIDEMVFKNKSLKESNYFIMGQICVAKSHRGQDIAGLLYRNLQERLAGTFEYIITEISTQNWRSLRAHEKVGFQILKKYTSELNQKEWVVVIWDWRN